MPGDGRAPVVAGDHRRFRTQGVEQTHHVADEVQERVLVDGLGPVGLPVPAHVGRHRVEAGLRKRRQLMPPGIPGLREAVAENDQRARPLLGDVHANAVRLDGAVLDLAHRLPDSPTRSWASAITARTRSMSAGS